VEVTQGRRRTGHQERHQGDDQSGEPGAPAASGVTPSSKTDDVTQHLEQKEDPEQRKHDEQRSHERGVAQSRRSVPSGDDNEGEENEVDRERRTPQGTGSTL
jgi:hypothetical protein